MAPEGVDVMARLRPTVVKSFGDAAHEGERQALDDRLKKEGYDARQRAQIEDLVEKSR